MGERHVQTEDEVARTVINLEIEEGKKKGLMFPFDPDHVLALDYTFGPPRASFYDVETDDPGSKHVGPVVSRAIGAWEESYGEDFSIISMDEVVYGVELTHKWTREIPTEGLQVNVEIWRWGMSEDLRYMIPHPATIKISRKEIATVI